jgi:hypothetical protein
MPDDHPFHSIHKSQVTGQLSARTLLHSFPISSMFRFSSLCGANAVSDCSVHEISVVGAVLSIIPMEANLDTFDNSKPYFIAIANIKTNEFT